MDGPSRGIVSTNVSRGTNKPMDRSELIRDAIFGSIAPTLFPRAHTQRRLCPLQVSRLVLPGFRRYSARDLRVLQGSLSPHVHERVDEIERARAFALLRAADSLHVHLRRGVQRSLAGWLDRNRRLLFHAHMVKSVNTRISMILTLLQS